MPHPWDEDLEKAFEDEELRTKVSEFLGENIQPYVTKLEESSAPDRDAQRLWESYSDKPVETSIQVTREIYGDEVADQFADILQGKETTTTTEPPETTTTTEPPETTTTTEQKLKFDDLPPEVQEAVTQVQAERAREGYYSELEKLKTDHAEDLPKGEDGKPSLDVDVFHPFVVAAEGDFENAFKAYKAWETKMRETYGIAEVPNKDEIPPTINSKTRDSSSTPPQEKSYTDWDTAMDDFFDEMKSPPTTVGSV